jgi:hypothetical protein
VIFLCSVFHIEDVKLNKEKSQGHREVTLKGAYEDKTMEFSSGTLLVRQAQPLGLLAAYLLEPESEDGLVTWNFFDSYLEPHKNFPICKLMRNVNLSSRVLEP